MCNWNIWFCWWRFNIILRCIILINQTFINMHARFMYNWNFWSRFVQALVILRCSIFIISFHVFRLIHCAVEIFDRANEDPHDFNTSLDFCVLASSSCVIEIFDCVENFHFSVMWFSVASYLVVWIIPGFANVSALTLHAVLLVLVVTGTVVEIVTLLLSLEPVATLITDSYFISTHLTSTK